MTAYLITRATVVLPTEARSDVAVLVEDGHIAAINPASSAHAQEVPLPGRLLVPGLIDLHCDAIEKEVEPRPGVHFPLEFACTQADRRNAAAGITTVYHALSFANHELGVRNNAFAAEVARALKQHQAHALVDNRVHARYEVTDETAPPILAELISQGHAQLLSFMDHSPGQGQFRDVQAYRDYLGRNYKTQGEALDQILEQKAQAARGAMDRMQALAGLARDYGVPLASHDDDSADKVHTVQSLGASLSEFPINLPTAQVARARGMHTLFGAPNILRGRSQAGNMRALDAVEAGVADCLCGDYSPATLLPAVLRLTELLGLPLAQALALVTRHPARALGLTDRGEIAIGKRADLVAVSTQGPVPHAEQVWVQGRCVFQASRLGVQAGLAAAHG
jgi:alpha-D-ribose 1-methylphosphonate 5-triphosphate diphosphatase